MASLPMITASSTDICQLDFLDIDLKKKYNLTLIS